MSLYDVLVEVKERLATINDVKSVGIGLPKNLSVKNCPFIRVVPTSDTQKHSLRTIEVHIIYGFDIKNKDIELMYEKMYEMQEVIINTLQYKLKSGDCFFHSNISDEDRMDNIKTAMSKFSIENIQIWKISR